MSAPLPSDAEAFYDFLGHALKQRDLETPPETLRRKWRAEREIDEACEDIRQGIANMEAGLGVQLEGVTASIQRKHGLGDTCPQS